MPINNIEVQNAIEVQKRFEQDLVGLRGAPMIAAVRQAAMIVEGTAKRYAKVDTGRYRASIEPEVKGHGDLVQGVVGSNVVYAPYAVLDTRPHWPPLSAVTLWARRHGISAYLVARAISRRGTKGDRSLMRGVDENVDRIAQILDQAINRIIS